MGVLTLAGKCILIVLISITCLSSGTLNFALASGNETDRLALLSLKDNLVGDYFPGALDSWNASHHFCEWQGVTCGRRHRRVVALELDGLKLHGSISPSVGNLTFLRQVNLSNNMIQGNIPKQVGNLRRLRIIDLSQNSLQGKIPTELSNCSNLESIVFLKNNLTGELPFQLGHLQNLARLSLGGNNLTGAIPSSLGNLSSLMQFSISFNHFEGNIPHALGRASNLRYLFMASNFLFGTIPPSFYNLSSLEFIEMATNHLSGTLAPNIGLAFPNLYYISIGDNQFTGTIPRSISNCSNLEIFDIVSNGFSGSLDNIFGDHRNLQELLIGFNNFGNGKPGDLDFLSSLTNSSLLRRMMINVNRFGGILPESIGNLSTNLREIYMDRNQISGKIPQGLGNLVGLTMLDMAFNALTGTIPSSIGKLQNLGRMFLFRNQLSGEIPSFFGNLTELFELSLHTNNFQGRIPLALGNCTKLQIIQIGTNKLGGNIPDHVFGDFTSLVLLNMSHNSLTGPIPSDFGNLKNLVELYVYENELSGEIPEELGQCSGLRTLDMAGNFFQGKIPLSFGSLRALDTLNLSRNNLSGMIPQKLEQLPFLSSLNLSFNHLEGQVPVGGVFNKSSGFSIMGNNNLCGGIPEMKLPKCLNQEPRKKGHDFSTKVIIFMVIGVIIVSVSVLFLVFLCHRKKLIPAAAYNLFGDGHLRVSYKELLEATGGFSSSNLIGLGSFGSVYKGTLHGQENPVAVKVLNLQNRGASKSFIAECKALRKIRHRNLLKIITSCSSIDYQGNDFKALVFEFIPNGSLDSWLHDNIDSRTLNFAQRLDIAIDVANAIDYLHHDCEALIIHCDLKPTNVLLDEDMVAHVSDFGLAKLMSGDTDSNMGNFDRTNSSMMKGTIGYIAPEYGMGGAVSQEGDIYSYGILVLEMITGKRPTDGMFYGGLSLHNFCKTALPERLREILDFHLLEQISENMERLRSKSNMEEEIWDCLVSFTKIGVACSAEVPSDRMRIKDAIKELHSTKARLVRTGIYRQDRGISRK